MPPKPAQRTALDVVCAITEHASATVDGLVLLVKSKHARTSAPTTEPAMMENASVMLVTPMLTAAFNSAQRTATTMEHALTTADAYANQNTLVLVARKRNAQWTAPNMENA